MVYCRTCVLAMGLNHYWPMDPVSMGELIGVLWARCVPLGIVVRTWRWNDGDWVPRDMG